MQECDAAEGHEEDHESGTEMENNRARGSASRGKKSSTAPEKGELVTNTRHQHATSPTSHVPSSKMKQNAPVQRLTHANDGQDATGYSRRQCDTGTLKFNTGKQSEP